MEINSFVIKSDDNFLTHTSRGVGQSYGKSINYFANTDIIYSNHKKSDLNFSQTNGGEQPETASINQGSSTKHDFEQKVAKSASRLVELASSEDYIEGESSKTQIYLEFLHEKDADVFQESFQRAWVILYRTSDYHLRNFINFASTIDYSWLGNKADALVMGVCSLPDILVCEAAIRAVESWGESSHIPVLERMRKFDVEWVEDYKLAVIRYLRCL